MNGRKLIKPLWNPPDPSGCWKIKGAGRFIIIIGLVLQLIGAIAYGVGLLWYRAVLEGRETEQ